MADRRSNLSVTGQWASAHKGLTTIGSIVGILGATVAFLWTNYSALSLDTERDEAIERYDHGYKGPPKVKPEDWEKGGMPEKTRVRTASLELKVMRLTEDNRQLLKSVRKAYWWQVGYAASDKEPCRHIRFQAAAFYRGQYDQLMSIDGTRPETAFVKSLAMPWHERRALVRRARCR